MYDTSTVIMLAGGGSREHVVRLIEAWPYARVWTLNAMRHPRATLQFEIHWPRPVAGLVLGQPTILSPYYQGDLAPHARRFPIVAASELGAPFFELSHDYMLAYAALMAARKLPQESVPTGLSIEPPERVILCGVDLSDSHHYARSRGVHFWCGVLRGLGVAVTVMEESTVFARPSHRDGHVPEKIERPYLYGQPREHGGNITWR